MGVGRNLTAGETWMGMRWRRDFRKIVQDEEPEEFRMLLVSNGVLGLVCWGVAVVFAILG